MEGIDNMGQGCGTAPGSGESVLSGRGFGFGRDDNGEYGYGSGMSELFDDFGYGCGICLGIPHGETR